MAEVSQTPDTIDWFMPKLNPDDFNKAILDQGNECVVEKSIPCPCTSRNINVPSNSCVNCQGSGYIFLDKKESIALIQGVNRNTRYEQWTEANTGISRITLRYADKLTIGDRITLTQVVEVFTEKLACFFDLNGNIKINTIYDIIDVNYLCLFIGIDQPVVYLEKNQFTISYNTIILSDELGEEINRDTVDGIVLSIRYTHRPQYIIFDSPRSNMVNKDIINCNQDIDDQHFPVSVMARIKHYQYSR